MKHTFQKTVMAAAIACAVTSSVLADNVYLFSYFKGNGEDGLHLAYSHDGLKWQALKNDKSFLTPNIGKDKLMRDPSICQGPDGTYHMVWTSGWWDRIIGYASSKDLVNWSEQKAIPVMEHEPEAKNSWAPELFYDDATRTYHILWATTIPGRYSEVATSKSENGLNHRIYYVTTKDFNTFSDTKIFFNPDFCAIDAAIMKQADGQYMMAVKNENLAPAEKNIRITRTTSLNSGFPTRVSEPITGDYWAEGPSPLQIDDYTYIYFDKYTQHKYGAVRSKDGQNWEDVSEIIEFPQGTRHGTAFTVPEHVLQLLLKQK
jgi:beta-galactosidase|nr:glycoside hydrolase family 43 protein [uncultured Muribaculum sp.]